MTDHSFPTHLPPGDGAGAQGDSFSDETATKPVASGVDQILPLTSDADYIRSNIPEQLEGLLPGEAALVYQFLRDRLATLFDDAGA